MSSPAVLYPVVLATPGQGSDVAGRDRVQSQSDGARVALASAAERAGAGELVFEKDPDDVPLPNGGWHWSVSHDATWVAGVVHAAPVGIDLERVAERRKAMRERVVSRAERALIGQLDGLTFIRIWTAKEAVLKAAGVGIAELSLCRLAEPPTSDALRLRHRGAVCLVRQARLGEHVVAVHAPGEDWRVDWSGLSG